MSTDKPKTIDTALIYLKNRLTTLNAEISTLQAKRDVTQEILWHVEKLRDEDEKGVKFM